VGLSCRILVTCLLSALIAVTLTGATVPEGRPEDVGMSTERLQRIAQVVRRAVDAREITGAVTVVARKGRTVHFETQGLMDVEAKRPMRRDAIFPIASMSKPITGVAILMLVEEGKVRLNDPVSRFVPEFKDTKVAVERQVGRGTAVPTGNGRGRASEIYTVPATREITVRDLMTHTSGLASGGVGAREAARIAPRRSTDNLASHVPALGAAPLDFQPGSQWAYSALAGIDTLGRIVEVASGMTFDEFLRRRLFEPLGMRDTAFHPAPDRTARVVTLYRRTPTGLDRQDVPEWLATRTLFSGGGGLWSTAEDYLQFAQMLVNKGELGGKRILGSRTVDLMASNHVGDLFARGGRTGGRAGMGFGLTVDVVLDRAVAGDQRSTGSFGWGGAFGTNFWVDPKEQLVGVLMVQTPGGSLRADFQNAVMQAIVD
jgi:CubicO group peptidase (beta-lactamase class C family)